MAKSFKKSLAMLIVTLMCVSMFAPQALAAETTTTTDTQSTTEGGITTTVTTTTETTVDGETTTVVVTIDTAKTGTDETGAEIDYRETTSETTVTTNEPDGSVTETESFVEDGTEVKEWDEIPEGVDLPEYEVPEVEVELIPGETTTGNADVNESKTTNDDNGTTKTTVTIDKTVTAETSDIEVTVESTETNLEAVAPEDYEGKHIDNNEGLLNGMAENTFGDAYLSTIPQPGEDGYDYQWTGYGEATNACRAENQTVVFVKDADGNPLVVDPDNFTPSMAPNGYLKNSDGTPFLVEGKYLVESLTPTGKYGDGFDSTPCIFALTKYDEEGNPETYYYAYCIDADTSAIEGSWYTVSNLDDSDYYPDEKSADMLRSVVTNGYWGQESGPGSLAHMRDSMEAYYGEGATITVEDKDGNPVTFTVEELLAAMDEAEVITATQAAIWSYSNGSIDVRNGTDGHVVTGLYSVVKPKSNLANCDRDYDYARDARLKMAYEWLMSLEGTPADEGAVIIDEDNFITDASIVVGDKDSEVAANQDDNHDNDVYNAALNFTLAFVPGENDELLMHLKYTDFDGEEQIIVKRLGTENSADTIAPAEDGSYTISGLKLSENEDFNFDLRLEGTQHLEKGVYIYKSYVSDTHPESQTMVGIAEGTQTVDVSASMTVSFSVDEENKVVAERKWHDESVPTVTITPPTPPQDDPPEEEEEHPSSPSDILTPPPTEITPDEEVPLAEVPYTGDDSAMWLLVIGPAGLGLVTLNLSDKKRKEENA